MGPRGHQTSAIDPQPPVCLLRIGRSINGNLPPESFPVDYCRLHRGHARGRRRLRKIAQEPLVFGRRAHGNSGGGTQPVNMLVAQRKTRRHRVKIFALGGIGIRLEAHIDSVEFDVGNVGGTTRRQVATIGEG